mgnify:CR=1 FL=1
MSESLHTAFPSNAEQFLTGSLLLINKPLNWTSFDVVNKVRGTLKNRLNIKKIKVGHAGTLDPLATGLLLICTGKWTKKIDSLQGMPKQYTGSLKLGATTPSYDAETEEDSTFSTDDLTEEKIKTAAKSFVGQIQQVPPMFSALKKDGIPLYKLAREGQTIARKARTVTIDTFDITAIEMPIVHFLVDCTKGTYIRSLAHDLGSSLDNGGYLTSLVRTKIGVYDVKDALSVEEVIKGIEGVVG